uniref:Ribosomal protein S1 n=1 Tax=Haplomitrium mnioides TaxID=56921 RepID=A0A6C0SKS7_9MARC|nr:ribosomal protein S1 [Haplomitrium mnioides]QIA60192.1 ribosomal protein S1 [Haplomitrium mnioides]
MSFNQLFPKYNSSFHPSRGSAIQRSVIQLQQNKVLVDTGPKTPIIRFQHELERVPITKQARFHFGIEDVEVFGEPKMLLPEPLGIKCKRKQVRIELTKIWRSDQNLVRGFIPNSVKGGYAVAIAGYIAPLPRSLLRSRKVFYSQWRIFPILNMKPEIGNIAVKEIGDSKIDSFPPTKSHQKQTKHLGARLKHWRDVEKNTNVKKRKSFSVPTTKKTEQSFKHLGPEPLAHTDKKRETTKQSAGSDVFQLKDQGRGK